MLKLYSTIFGQLLTNLYDWELSLHVDLSDDSRKYAPLDEEDKKRISYHLTVSTNMAHELGLDAAVALVERMWKRLEAGYSREDLYRDISDLRSRIEDQLKGRYFLFISPSLVQYYEQKQLFGQEVANAFPKAIDDIEGAGKCLAVGQGTACVMHLMRVMEVGLKALAKSLKIDYAPSWDGYLNKIQSKIDTKRKTKGVKWKRDEKFYRDVSGDLVSVKHAWRNPSMHVDRRYSTEEAEEIFKTVKAFMCKLAARMDENGQDLTWSST